jgi:ubiquinone/menaquinone biosynthesis C-methylase UbiE
MEDLFQKRKIARSYNKLTYEHPIKKFFLQRRVNEFIEELNLKPTDMVLDIGTGSGVFGLRIQPSVFRVIFSDASQAMLRTLRDRVDKLELIQLDCRRLPFADFTFDKIICMGVVAEIAPREIPMVIKEMIRITVEGGVIYFDLPTPNIFKKISEFWWKIKHKEARELSWNKFTYEFFRKYIATPVEKSGSECEITKHVWGMYCLIKIFCRSSNIN